MVFLFYIYQAWRMVETGLLQEKLVRQTPMVPSAGRKKTSLTSRCFPLRRVVKVERIVKIQRGV